MQSQDIDNSEFEEEDNSDAILQSLGGRLLALAEDQVRHRTLVEQRWLADLRQVHAKLTHAEQTALAGAGKSQLVVNITRNKCNAAEARLIDLAAPTDTRHWGIKPTPIPELARMDMDAPAQQNGQPIVDQQGQQVSNRDIVADINEKAKKQAGLMETAISDQLIEAGFNGQIRDIIHDAVRLGTGIIKAPIVVGRQRKSWEEVDGSGVYELGTAEDLRPATEAVSCWNFFPDMRAVTIDEAEYTFERKFLTRKMLRNLATRPGYIVEQISELLKEDPIAISISETHTDEMRNISGVDMAAEDNRYELWEYHGEISFDDLVAAGAINEEEEENPLEVYSGIVEFCGSRVIRALINPMDSGDNIYSVFCWEEDNSSIFGYGVPYLMRNSQKVINASWRMLMDNAGLSVGGQVIIDRNKVTPADGRWELSARKIWFHEDKLGGRVHDAFNITEIESHQQELSAIFDMARQFADEETNLPLIAQGEQTSNITDTAKGMAILMSSADVVMRKTVKSLDDNVYKPLITRFYDWNMQYNPDDSIKGDYEVDARGSDAMMEQAAQESGLMEMANLAGSPAYAPLMKFREMLVRIAKGKKLNPDEIIKTEDELKQEAQNRQPQVDPVLQAQIQLDQQRLQLDQMIAQSDAQLKQQELADKRELGYAKLAMDKELTIGKLAQSLGFEKEKLMTTRQVEGVKAMNFQDELAVKQRTGSGI